METSSTLDKGMSSGRMKGMNLRQRGKKHPQYKHGDSGNRQRARLYQTWASMKERCLNPNVPDYKYYGGCGIEVCDSWSSDYTVFREWAYDNGYADNLTIDRIDNSSGYYPDNCQFLTRIENVKKQWKQWRERRIQDGQQIE